MDNNIYNCLNLQDHFKMEEIEGSLKFDPYVEDTNESMGSFQDFGSVEESKSLKDIELPKNKLAEKSKRIIKREKAK